MAFFRFLAATFFDTRGVLVGIVYYGYNQRWVDTFSVISSSYDRSMTTLTLLASSSDIRRRFVIAGICPTVSHIKYFNVIYIILPSSLRFLFFSFSLARCSALYNIAINFISAGVYN